MPCAPPAKQRHCTDRRIEVAERFGAFSPPAPLALRSRLQDAYLEIRLRSGSVPGEFALRLADCWVGRRIQEH